MPVITSGSVYKCIYTWTGFAGQPGYTVLHFDASSGTAQAASDAGRAFLNTAAGTPANNLPAGVKITAPSSVDTLDVKTGFLVTSTSVTPGTQILGNGSGGYGAPAGGCVTWQTADFRPTRPPAAPGISRVRGRTFIIPTAAANTFDSTDGTLTTGFITTLGTAVTNLVTGTVKLVVWSRPTSAVAADGSMSVVTGGKITDKVAILTSRRD